MNSKNKVDVVTITETQQRALEEKIVGIRSAMDNSVFELAPLLRELAEGKAHIRDGYTNFKEYVVDRLNIGASSAMNLIALSKRYAEGGSYAIPDKWKEYGFAKLQLLKNHTNTEIEAKGITANMTVSDIMEAFKPAIEEAKSEEAKSEEAKSEEAKSEEAKSEEAKSEEAKSEEAKSEEIEATINLSEVLEALKTKEKRTAFENWLKVHSQNGLQYVKIVLGA